MAIEKTKRRIERRLNTLDNCESQIWCGKRFLSADDYVELNRIHEEQKELKDKLAELEAMEA